MLPLSAMLAGYPEDAMPAPSTSVGTMKTVLQSFKSNIQRMGLEAAIAHARAAAEKREKYVIGHGRPPCECSHVLMHNTRSRVLPMRRHSTYPHASPSSPTHVPCTAL